MGGLHKLTKHQSSFRDLVRLQPKEVKNHLCESGEAKRKFPTRLSRGAGSPEPFDLARAPLLPGEMKALCSAPSDQTLARQRWWLAPGKTVPPTAAVLKRAIFKRSRMHSTAWRGGEWLETDIRATREEPGAFLLCLQLQDSPLRPGKSSLRPFIALAASALLEGMP